MKSIVSMKHYLAGLFLLIFILNSGHSLAQSSDSTWIKVVTKNAQAIVTLDGKPFQTGKLMRVDSGMHIIVGQAYGTKKVTREVRCRPGKVNLVRFVLPYTDKYAAHLKSVKRYKFKKNAFRFTPAMLYIVFAGFQSTQILASTKKADDYLFNAKESESKYNTSFWPGDIQNNQEDYVYWKSRYEEEIDNINKLNQSILVGAGVTVGLTAIGWYISSKFKAPTYSESTAFQQLQFTPYFTAENKGFHLSYRF